MVLGLPAAGTSSELSSGTLWVAVPLLWGGSASLQATLRDFSCWLHLPALPGAVSFPGSIPRELRAGQVPPSTAPSSPHLHFWEQFSLIFALNSLTQLCLVTQHLLTLAHCRDTLPQGWTHFSKDPGMDTLLQGSRDGFTSPRIQDLLRCILQDSHPVISHPPAVIFLLRASQLLWERGFLYGE